MKKKGSSRKLLGLAVGWLTFVHIALDWAILGWSSFPEAVLEAGLPLALGAGAWLLESKCHPVKTLLVQAEGKGILNLAVPLVLGGAAYRMLMQGQDPALAFAGVFALSVCVAAAAFPGNTFARVGILMVHFGLLWQLGSAFADTLAILILTALFLLREYDRRETEDDRVLVLTAAISIGIFVWIYGETVLEGLLDSWLPDRMSEDVLDAFLNLLTQGKLLGRAGLGAEDRLVLKENCRLAYLAAWGGWLCVVPSLAALGGILVAGGKLCAAGKGRKGNVLAWSCYGLLLVRILDGLLTPVGLELGACRGIPFQDGWNFLNCLLAAVLMLQPDRAPDRETLEAMEPEDPDYPAVELEWLRDLPEDNEGLCSLCGYVFDRPERTLAWAVLAKFYAGLMTPGVRQVMAANGYRLFGTDTGQQLPRLLDFNLVKVEDAEPDADLSLTTADFETEGTVLVQYLPWAQEREVTVPPFFDTVAAGAFAENSRLRRIVLADTVREIGSEAFRDCESLEEAVLPEKLEILGASAFRNTALAHIRLPETLEVLEADAFHGSRLEEVYVPGSVADIGPYAFAGTPLKTVELGEGVRQILPGAFKNCTCLEEIMIPDSLGNVAEDAFAGCGSFRIRASESWMARHPTLRRRMGQ